VVPGYYSEVGLIARQAKKLGINVPLLGGDGWDSPKLVEIGGDAINGSYYSNHFSVDDSDPAIQKFVGDYKARFGAVPDALAGLGYDAGRLLMDAIKRANSAEPAKIREAIAQTKDFPGISGKISIGPDRNAVKAIVMLQVQDGKLKSVEAINP